MTQSAGRHAVLLSGSITELEVTAKTSGPRACRTFCKRRCAAALRFPLGVSDRSNRIGKHPSKKLIDAGRTNEEDSLRSFAARVVSVLKIEASSLSRTRGEHFGKNPLHYRMTVRFKCTRLLDRRDKFNLLGKVNDRGRCLAWISLHAQQDSLPNKHSQRLPCNDSAR
jgi:hypothetical protein